MAPTRRHTPVARLSRARRLLYKMTSRALAGRFVLAGLVGLVVILLTYIGYKLLLTSIALIYVELVLFAAELAVVLLGARVFLAQRHYTILSLDDNYELRERILVHLDVPALQLASVPAWTSPAQRYSIINSFFPSSLFMWLTWRASQGRPPDELLALLDRLYLDYTLTVPLLAFADQHSYRSGTPSSDSRTPDECLALLHAVAATQEAMADEPPEFVLGLLDTAVGAWRQFGAVDSLANFLALSRRISR